VAIDQSRPSAPETRKFDSAQSNASSRVEHRGSETMHDCVPMLLYNYDHLYVSAKKSCFPPVRTVLGVPPGVSEASETEPVSAVRLGQRRTYLVRQLHPVNLLLFSLEQLGLHTAVGCIVLESLCDHSGMSWPNDSDVGLYPRKSPSENRALRAYRYLPLFPVHVVNFIALQVDVQ
jgi:hypothetical protein